MDILKKKIKHKDHQVRPLWHFIEIVLTLMFVPNDIVTVWIALDDMEDVIGKFQCVKGSHKWGEGSGPNLVESAA